MKQLLQDVVSQEQSQEGLGRDQPPRDAVEEAQIKADLGEQRLRVVGGILNHIANVGTAPIEHFVDPGVWVKPWDVSFAEAYANLRVGLLVGVSGVDGEFYALFQRDAALEWNHGPCFGRAEPINLQCKNDKVSVLVDVIEGANGVQAYALPSVVRFHSPKEINPGVPYALYLSLFNGVVKPMPAFLGLANGKGNVADEFRADTIVLRNGERKVVKSTSEIVDGVPYGAYQVTRHRLVRSEEHLFLIQARVCVGDDTVSVVPKEPVKSGLKLFDVLVGPLEFLPRSSYFIQSLAPTE